MKYLFYIFFFCFCFNGIAESFQDYKIDSTVYRSSLKNNEAAFHFTINNLPEYGRSGAKIIYSYGKGNQTAILNSKNQFEVKLVPGSYSFQLYYTNRFFEITTHKIKVNNRFKVFISCYLESSEDFIQVEKPVIYLYPESPMIVDVKVIPKGNLFFTYPQYNDGWNVMANPSGELKIKDQSYNYLFWESTQSLPTINMSAGFILLKENVVSFLETKLDAFGFNDKEKADFITYWGPQLSKYDKTFIRFEFNESCDQFAILNITPKPNNIFRFYILFTELTEHDELKVTEQEIIKIDRKGFTVIEWGGAFVPNALNNI